MWRVGFEPTKALSHRLLRPAPLTAREPPHDFFNKDGYKKLYKYILLDIFENDHNNLETPDLISHSEVKQIMLWVLVSEMK